jgi:hypothetical protein
MNSYFGRKHAKSGDEDVESQVSDNDKENAATNAVNRGKTPFVVQRGFHSNTSIYFRSFRTGQ